MHTVNILRHLIDNHEMLVYIFIYLGLIVEGEFVLILTGILLLLGALNLPLTVGIIFFGVISKTLLGYYIGTLVHKRWNHMKFLKRIEKHVLKIMPHFKQKPFLSIFISKFIFGINNIVIIFAGYQKIDFKKYLKAEFCSTVIFAPSLILLGYLFSYTALLISHEIWGFSFIVLLLVALFIIIDRAISWVYEFFEEFYDDE
jgi:membrane protein DedA with SNARE-associated domain